MSSFWRRWLIIWCIGVAGFGLVLAGGASNATSGPVQWILDSLQGPGEITFTPVMRFSLAVMGCVTIGWAVTTLAVMLVAFRSGAQARSLWIALTIGVLVWFVTDSALSLATGFGLNVIPNIVLFATYLIGVSAGGGFSNTAARAQT